jgi:hypothetical protein
MCIYQLLDVFQRKQGSVREEGDGFMLDERVIAWAQDNCSVRVGLPTRNAYTNGEACHRIWIGQYDPEVLNTRRRRRHEKRVAAGEQVGSASGDY